MWADELSSDNKYAAAFAIGRIGELVAELDIDHVRLVATLSSSDLDPVDVLKEINTQISEHRVFIDRISRIRSNLEAIAVILEQSIGPRDEPRLAM